MASKRTALARILVFAFAVGSGSAEIAQAQSPDAAIRAIISGPKFRTATTFIESDHERFVDELITLTEIPAPPFKEARRAEAYLQLLRTVGLLDVEQDPEGNVFGIRKGIGNGPMLAVVAHLDTVFPEGTDVRVRREGTKLMAPGIGDDTRGLASLLAVIRSMNAAKFETTSDILFVGSVGEEGEGDLRGVRYLIEKGRYKDAIKLFVAIDGPDLDRVANGALGSKRYRATFSGPGGHSYGAFGLVNPAFAMADAIQRFASIPLPKAPKTTVNVGVVGGGTSVNAIPVQVFMDVDMRSESRTELEKVSEAFLRIVQEAADKENQRGSTAEGKLTVDVKLIGDRPSGETSVESSLAQSVSAVLRAFGMNPVYTIGSTDANIPIRHNIPALTVGRGGKSGRTHSLDEWADVERTSSVEAIRVILAIVLSVAGGH